MSKSHISVEFWDCITELEKNVATLKELRDRHLNGAAAIVRALVEKRIIKAEQALAAVRGAA